MVLCLSARAVLLTKEENRDLLKLGEEYLRQDGKVDNHKALAILEPLAEKGDNKAIERVFSIYLSWYELELLLGEHMELEHHQKKATTKDKLYYYARKGFLNDPKHFADELGVCYWLGAGVKRDQNTAVELIKRCDNPLNQLASYFLGLSIMNGEHGCSSDREVGLSILAAQPGSVKSFFATREAVNQILFSSTDRSTLLNGEKMLLDNTINFPKYGTDFLSLYAYLYIVPDLEVDHSDKWFEAAQNAGVGIFSSFMDKEESKAAFRPELQYKIRYYIEKSLQSSDPYIAAVALAKMALYEEYGAFSYTRDTTRYYNTLRQLAKSDLFAESPYYFPAIAYQLYAGAETKEEKSEALNVALMQDESHPLLTFPDKEALALQVSDAEVIQKLKELKSTNQYKEMCVLSMLCLYRADIMNDPTKRLELCGDMIHILSDIDDPDVSLVLECLCTLEEHLFAYDKETMDLPKYAEVLKEHARNGIAESAYKCALAYAAGDWGFPRDMTKAVHYADMAKENMHEGGPIFLMAVYLYAASGLQHAELFLKEAEVCEKFETPFCMLLLANYYHKNWNNAKRRFWLQKAAKLGSLEAEKLLRFWNILQ